jgi:hypothetical protein
MARIGNVIHDQLDWSYALHSDNGATFVTYLGNALYNDTYYWCCYNYDYRLHPGNPHPKTYNPQRIQGNYWQEGDANSGPGNTAITGPQQIPGVSRRTPV